MKKKKMACIRCHSTDIGKERAFDGRRRYRCRACNQTWTSGMQGKKKSYKLPIEGTTSTAAVAKRIGHIRLMGCVSPAA